MATLKTSVPAHWAGQRFTETTTHTNLLNKFFAFADSQAEKKTMWFFLTLIVQGVFFLPLPAFLVYYYNAPIIVLMVTMTCFFTTIIACMGGAGIRAVLLFSAASIFIQLLMAFFVII